ncbi:MULTISPECIES: glucose-6-phosphate isomerase [unclassified Carboxydocella]|uniref:glucose-6-phosphate isomerase n=1 Tax=unclassified Carboxydocella TaxID=2685367 RepID=UPI0009AE6925|nr:MULTISPECIES: glucose-6-phosphate isomerase [unclassified Carboxydocella]AVX30803.1 glucose-6-phosphate isomerase [Carboxydocella thermautotrophica]GAW30052.1 glucose-6-phosphate isomerase [Carboxydocella sp. ULO1]GAW31208.1 glucose-6-phosphate isomerase [Carboxydocella sp. JDF658]
MKNITLDYGKALAFVREEELSQLAPAVKLAHQLLHEKKGPGQEFTGWVEWPQTYDRQEFERIKNAAARIKEQADALIVIGIGGSYLGARAAIELLGHTFRNQLKAEKRQAPEIYFAGNNLSPVYLKHLLEVLEGKELALNVISKSGTTTEPALAFRFFRELLERKYGVEGARERIYVTTDRNRGALKRLATEKGYETFVIPDEIGGRYSVLTAVGMLPIAAAGIDIEEIMAGAREAMELYANQNLEQNPAYQYAALRNLLYAKGKTLEVLVSYEPQLHSFAEWWKQLYGESEGKDGKGIFPAAVEFSTDLHSLGQYLQEGLRNLFETVLMFEQSTAELFIPEDPDDSDGLNFVSGKSLDFVNKQAFAGTLLAHADGGVPALVVNIPANNPYYFGQLVYFFEKACGISGYLLGVNPFNQPGVEAYKKNMFALLGKPGYEQLRQELLKRL